MKRLLLHIGTHKTGTTYLQKFINANVKQLAAQGIAADKLEGVYPPHLNTRTGYFATTIARRKCGLKAVTDKDYKSALKDFKIFTKRVAQYDTLLLSDERIWLQGATTPNFWTELKEIFDRCGIEQTVIIVYLRRQDEFALSLWKECVTGDKRLRMSFRKFLKNPRYTKALAYHKCLLRIKREFQPQQLIVREYNRNIFENNNICYDFCSALGIAFNDEFVVPEGEVNLSLNNSLIAFKRIANTSPAYRETSNFLRIPLTDINMARSSTKSSTLLTPKLERRLQKRYARGNSIVARKFMEREDGVLFEWPDNLQTHWEPDTDQMLHDTIAVLVDALAIEHTKIRRLEERVKDLENSPKKRAFNAKIKHITKK